MNMNFPSDRNVRDMRGGVRANEMFISSIRMLRTLCWRNSELSSRLNIKYSL